MKILNENHIITGNEYFRELKIFGDSSIIKWSSIRYFLHEKWKFKSFKEIFAWETENDLFRFSDYEFVMFDSEQERLNVQRNGFNFFYENRQLNFKIFCLWNDYVEYFIRDLTLQEKISMINKEVDICPRCNNKIIEKHGKFGIFYGCNNYPACDFTIKNKDDFKYKTSIYRYELLTKNLLKGTVLL